MEKRYFELPEEGKIVIVEEDGLTLMYHDDGNGNPDNFIWELDCTMDATDEEMIAAIDKAFYELENVW